MKHNERQRIIATYTMDFVDKGHDLVKARELAKAKQLNRFIGIGRIDITPKIHPCAGR